MVSQINKIILKSLSTGDKYGLELIKDIQNITNNRVVLKQPSLYSALRRMEKKGLISSFWEDSELGGRRHYYSLTRSGREELQSDSVVSESDIQSILYEVNKSFSQGDNLSEAAEPVIKKTATFERFDPTSDQVHSKSFSQQVRKYDEPATIREKSVTQPKIAEAQAPEVKEETSFWRENLQKNDFGVSSKDENRSEFEFRMEENKPNKFEINYKDILGDLDADKSNEATLPPPPPVQPVQQNSDSNQQRASEYSRQISQIFATTKPQQSPTTITKEQEELREAIFKKHNQSTLDEISRRYNIDTGAGKPAKTTAQIVEEDNFGNFAKVAPAEIEVKQYVRKTEEIAPSKKEFLNINKLILTRSMIMAFFFAMSVLISYFVFSAQNFIYSPHACLYWIALGAVAVYIGVILLLTLPNLSKKIQLKKINWFVRLFYRLLIAIALYTFVIAMCLCFGMTNFMQIEYFTIWYLASLAIGGIIVSWVLSVIIYSTKAFRE